MEGKFNNFVVGDVPTLMYIPNFVTVDEENQLLNNIYEAPVSKWKSLKNRRLQNWGGVVHEKGLLPQELPSWLTKITRRIYEESELFPSAINHVLINEYHPNQGIMPHQDGPAYFPVVAILSLGSPAVMDFTPHSKLRFGSNTLKGDAENRRCDGRDFKIETHEWIDNHHPFSVLLMPRSLLIFKDNAYSDYLHGIKDSVTQQHAGAVNETQGMMHQELNEKADQAMRTGDLKVIHRTTTRISLTCRLVLKVHRNLFKF
ncbi:alpha-ketoglutarate-dependent dioxygenase alkB 6 [Tripterygium wilfordii]|uniref:Alpha-ketoglutarate-dependent dioxygenase alkB 6 n=1 Tax=Tripterygium wilfordii TaxID=458696 RepID=A0A7J7DRC0_TRIWF|nr:alpha-ketoglutarate-dependent dioxygenase alkB homolog 6 [Tripterygium wilfordii]XP_038698809.1 alpha-ketoglutarate-dependent dioxygenase alkB homolog 6 [Tripterygium wilfordii]KAF5748857.1 alpha-ketoglutarate-dependent dioxygenase alkB 6 [Tripterygium wilfordii]